MLIDLVLDLSGDLDIDVAVEYIAATSPIITPVEGRIKFVQQSDLICTSASERLLGGLLIAVLSVTTCIWMLL